MDQASVVGPSLARACITSQTSINQERTPLVVKTIPRNKVAVATRLGVEAEVEALSNREDSIVFSMAKTQHTPT
jgi:hypothetical protein